MDDNAWMDRPEDPPPTGFPGEDDDVSWDDLEELTDEELETRWLERLAKVYGTPSALVHVSDHGGFSPGDPKWDLVLPGLRELRAHGPLTADAYLYVVVQLTAEWEFEAGRRDPVAVNLLARMRVMRRELDEQARALRELDVGLADDWFDRDDEAMPEEYQRMDAEWQDRCLREWRAWLKELGEEELARLHEDAPEVLKRRVAAGRGDLGGPFRPGRAIRFEKELPPPGPYVDPMS